MKCVNCNANFSGREGAKFCSTKCRVAFHRNGEVLEEEPILEEDPVLEEIAEDDGEYRGSVTNKTLKEMGPDDLYLEIGKYMHDTWAESQEYAELMTRLKTMSYEELQKGGYHIPNWKRPFKK